MTREAARAKANRWGRHLPPANGMGDTCTAQGRLPQDGARIGTKPLPLRYASKIHVMQEFLVSKSTFFIAGLVLASFSMQGALAADQKQCADQFKAADLNNDGVIVKSEMGSSPSMIPASLSNKARISRKEYMAACTKEAPKK
jgi:hypothetical protein